MTAVYPWWLPPITPSMVVGGLIFVAFVYLAVRIWEHRP